MATSQSMRSVEESKSVITHPDALQRLAGKPDTFIDVSSIQQVGGVLRENASRCTCGAQTCKGGDGGCPGDKEILTNNRHTAKAVTEKILEEGFDIQTKQGRDPFIGLFGAACPAPCQSACTQEINAEPVAIKENEMLYYELARKYNWFDKLFTTKGVIVDEDAVKNFAIAGSGPASMMLAYRLKKDGHNVTIFEMDEEPGGLLRYGIPDHKLGKEMLDFYFGKMQEMGINIVCNQEVTKEFLNSGDYQAQKFDKLILATGVGDAPRELNVPGSESKSEEHKLTQALGLVSAANREMRANGNLRSERVVATSPVVDEFCIVEDTQSIRNESDNNIAINPQSARGKFVIVYGRGDTARDAIQTAMRQQFNGEDNPACGQVVSIYHRGQKLDRRSLADSWPNMSATIKEDQKMLEEMEQTSASTKLNSKIVEVIRDDAERIRGVRVEHVLLESEDMVHWPKELQKFKKDPSKGGRVSGDIDPDSIHQDIHGRPVDRRGHLIDQQGRLIDGSGHLVDEQGRDIEHERGTSLILAPAGMEVMLVTALGFEGPKKNRLYSELGVVPDRKNPHRVQGNPDIYITGDAAKPSSQWLIIEATTDAERLYEDICKDVGTAATRTPAQQQKASFTGCGSGRLDW